MKIESVTSVAVITSDPAASRRLYMDALGLPLKQLDGDYFATDEIRGFPHFGVWPLSQAAEACFGVSEWPDAIVVPQMSLEFELASTDAVDEGAEELKTQGYQLLHDRKTEPWGQVIARVLSPEGVIVGLSFAPSLHEDQ
jgi:catechol 2,3-dioxygenase-like lactoylglutathione lyase family enzyme